MHEENLDDSSGRQLLHKTLELRELELSLQYREGPSMQRGDGHIWCDLKRRKQGARFIMKLEFKNKAQDARWVAL